MREIFWDAPDGRRYAVTLLQEPWDIENDSMTIVYRCVDDGWLGAAELDIGPTLDSLTADDLVRLLERARSAEG
jgi:hypothetical protein